MIVPPESYFSSNYKLVETTKKQFEFGFDDTIFNEEKKIVKRIDTEFQCGIGWFEEWR